MVHGITKSRTRLSNLYYTHCDGGWDMWVSLPWQGNLFHIVLADFLLCECITFQLKKKKIHLFLTNPEGGELGEVSPGMPPAIHIKPSCPMGFHTHRPEPALSF